MEDVEHGAPEDIKTKKHADPSNNWEMDSSQSLYITVVFTVLLYMIMERNKKKNVCIYMTSMYSSALRYKQSEILVF